MDNSVGVSFRANWPGFQTGDAQDVQVVEGFAYLATGAGLLILDVSDPTSPRQVGDYPSDSPATRIAVRDGFAYVLAISNEVSAGSLNRFDVHNPALPRRVRQYLNGSPRDFVLASNSICLVDGASLVLLNTNCALIGSLTASNGNAGSVAASATNVYVAWSNGIGGYDISNPASPIQRAFIIQPPGQLATDGGYLLSLAAGQERVQLQVLDPNNLSLIGTDVRLGSLGDANQGASLVTTATNAYVVTAGDTANGLGVYRIADPSRPTLTGRRLFSDGAPRRLSVAGSLAYVAAGAAGLKIFDLTTAANPVPVGQFFTAVRANSVAVQGDIAYVLDANSGFHILDITDPSNPLLMASYNETAQTPAAIAVQGHYVYLGLNAPKSPGATVSDPALEIVDVADPNHPRRVALASLPSPEQGQTGATVVSALVLQDDLALIASYLGAAAAVSIADTSNPLAPQPVGRFDLAGANQIVGIALQGRYAYLAGAKAGLLILDLSNPANPVQASAYPESGVTYSVLLRSNLCFLTGSYGTDVLDVSGPRTPIPLGRTSISGPLTSLSGTLALESTGNGIAVLDLINPTNPAVVGQYGGFPGRITSAARYVFTAGDQAGLTILDLGSNFSTAPLLLSQTLTNRALPGGTASFFAAVSGTVPLSYQWFTNGAPIVGATSPSLVLTNVQAADAGQYSLMITNASGSTTSAPIALTVDSPPNVTLTSPADRQVLQPSASIIVAADASDIDGSVAQVAFYADSNLVAIVSTPPYSWTNNLSAGTYTFKAQAMDNEGALSDLAQATVIVAASNVFQLSRTNYVVHKSNGVATVTVLSSSNGPASVNFTNLDATAFAVPSGGIGNYYGTNGVLDFPAGAVSRNISIRIVNDLVNRGTRQFVFQLSAPSSGWQLAYPSNAYVTIIDDTPLTNNFTDVSLPTDGQRGALQVWLQPTNAQGRWRFWWESDWRPSGGVASNLVAGDYQLQFMPRYGYVTPGDLTVSNFNMPYLPITNSYAIFTNSHSGDLSLTLLPAEVAGASDPTNRGQWRLVGEANTNWQDGGTTLSSLAEGAHLIEFKPVGGGFQTPAQQVVFVLGNQHMVYQAEYEPVPASAANGPVPLDSYNTITNDAVEPGTPYRFCGQLWSEGGYGSGAAVKARTVLTAAHVVFNPITLSYSSNVWWFFQRQRGEYEPSAQRARGWHVFEGYAAQRSNDLNDPNIGLNEESTSTRFWDAAALYFFENIARGGYSGYLITTTNNEWLASSAFKLVVGYPVESVPQGNVGKMHISGPFYSALQKITNSLYSSALTLGYGGNSGGPLCLLSTNSLGRPFFIPAGVYLGGSGNSQVRAIDLDVVDLINRAEFSANGGTNNTGGGVIPVSSVFGSILTQPAYLYITIGPAAAVRAGGAWRISPTNYGDLRFYTNYLTTNYFVATTSTNFSIEMKDGVTGFTLPANLPAVVLSSGSQLEVDLVYQAIAGGVFTPRLIYDRIQGLGVVAGALTTNWTPHYRIDTATQLNGSSWLPIVTNLSTNVASGYTNWIPNTVPARAGSRLYRAVWVP